MNPSDFNKVVEEQIKMSTDVLVKKAGEYATTDRLHNFKVTGALKGETPQQALGGFMAKHTVSIYDMIRNSSNTQYSLALWNEKITDHINYLLLLKALIIEEENSKSNP